MKQTIYILCLLFCFSSLSHRSYAQKHDRHWLGGYGSAFIPEELAILMTFNDDDISYSNFHSNIDINMGVLSMSDKDGKLLFCTNGNVVESWDHKIMHGGKGFNQGATNDDFLAPWGPDTTYNTSYFSYTYWTFPDPFHSDIYYLVHAFVLEVEGCNHFYVPKIQISKIDMSANGGKGKVIYKNRILDEEVVGAGFALIRHGNGRDWWVVLRKPDGLAYRSLLLQRDSVVQVTESNMPGLDNAGFSWEDCYVTNGSPLVTSLDGSRLLDIYGFGGAKLMSFDRCNGEVSLLDTFHTGVIPLTLLGGSVINCQMFVHEFSPSGRYLYGASYAEFAQWDLEAPDIAASKVTLGGVPWALNDDQTVMVGINGGFHGFAHGPDGKIYNLFRSAHSVIHHPDEPGEASDLCLAADNAPGSCLGSDVPYYLHSNRHPNYRLGPLTGSGCDTILSDIKDPAGDAVQGYQVKVWPSIATGPAEVEITLPSYGATSTAEIQVVDMLGRVLHRHRFPPFAYVHRLDAGGWASGVYNIVLLDKGRMRASARMVVAR